MYKVYGQKNCRYCELTRELLAWHGIRYEYIDINESCNIDAKTIFLGKGFRTVPQIWDEQGNHIGGYTELQKKYDQH